MGRKSLTCKEIVLCKKKTKKNFFLVIYNIFHGYWLKIYIWISKWKQIHVRTIEWKNKYIIAYFLSRAVVLCFVQRKIVASSGSDRLKNGKRKQETRKKQLQLDQEETYIHSLCWIKKKATSRVLWLLGGKNATVCVFLSNLQKNHKTKSASFFKADVLAKEKVLLQYFTNRMFSFQYHI